MMELAERLWHHPKPSTIGEPFVGLPYHAYPVDTPKR
jgi:hypothetical protein